MKKRIIYAVVSIMLIIFGFFAYFIGNNNEKDNELLVNAEVNLNLNCGSAYLIEETTGKVIYSQNETK